jgi:hypothetical protein
VSVWKGGIDEVSPPYFPRCPTVWGLRDVDILNIFGIVQSYREMLKKSYNAS